MDNLIDGLVRITDRAAINPEFLSSTWIQHLTDDYFEVNFIMSDGKAFKSKRFYTESEAICWLEDLKVE